MILVKLNKNYMTYKMHVMQWEFVTKEQASKITSIKGVREILNECDVPAEFYKNHLSFYLENGLLRWEPTTVEHLIEKS